MRSILNCLLLACALGAISCAVTPRHEILPKPEHIRTGVGPGDTVEIDTVDGRSIELKVRAVTGTAIVGETQTIDFADIATIAKRSWQPPTHPCGAGEPVGCSIPEVVLVLSEDYDRQTGKFAGACATHDFCYRHGFATYGETRASCDDVFYDDMKAACSSMGAFSFLDPKELAFCQAAALQTYEAVKRYGEPHFRTTTSSVCEYR